MDAEKLVLKPCPFCGSPAVLEHDNDHHGQWFNLGCARHWGNLRHHEEPCIGGRIFYTEAYGEEADAIAAWNRRAPDPVARAEALEEAASRLALIEPDESAAGCSANWGDFVRIAQAAIRALNHGGDND